LLTTLQCIANNLAYLEARELLGSAVGLKTGLDLAEEMAREPGREPERLPCLLPRRLGTPDDESGPSWASASAMRC